MKNLFNPFCTVLPIKKVISVNTDKYNRDDTIWCMCNYSLCHCSCVSVSVFVLLHSTKAPASPILLAAGHGKRCGTRWTLSRCNSYSIYADVLTCKLLHVGVGTSSRG